MDWWNELIGQDYSGEPSFYGGEDTPIVGDQSLLGDITATDLSGTLNPLDSYLMGGGNVPSNYTYDTQSINSYNPFGGITPIESYAAGGGAFNANTGTPAVSQSTPSLSNGPSATPFSIPGMVSEGYDKLKSGGSSVLDFANKHPQLAQMGLGTVASLMGNVMNQNATKQGQSNYLNAVSWTPDKVNNYMNALRDNVTSVYGNAAQGQNKAMSASDAVRGTGGGGYGKNAERIGREMRSNIATAMNQGSLTTNQPNTNINPAAFTQTDPYADTLKGLGNTIAQSASNDQLLKLLGILK